MKVPAVEADERLFERQLDVDSGKGVAKGGELRREGQPVGAVRQRDAQRALVDPGGALDLFEGARDFPESRADPGEQGAAGVGQVHRTCRAGVKARADPVLQRLELMADRRWPDAQGLGGATQGTLLGYRKEHFQTGIGQFAHY